MNKIKFSFTYQKLLDMHNDLIESAILLHVFRVEISDLQKPFVDYDTDNGLYTLPPHGPVIVLLFLKPSDTPGITDKNLFTTIRRWQPWKETFYRELIGQRFEVVVKKEPRQ
jgi:hypothetical protein